jgi:hypothetical protein
VRCRADASSIRPELTVAPASIPEPLLRFIKEHIHSVLQLEVLLLMRERGGDWTADALARELRITQQSAELRLVDLRLRGLLAPGVEPGSFRYAPSSPELALLTDALAELYAAARYTVINLIFSEPGDSARTLAEAFRLRRKGDNDAER